MPNPTAEINLSRLIEDLRSDNVSHQCDAAHALGNAGRSAVPAINALITLSGDTKYQYRDTGVAAQTAIHALSSIAQAIGDQDDFHRGVIVNRLINSCLCSNGKPAWSAIGELKTLASAGLMRVTETDKLESLLTSHANSYNISSWGSHIEQAVAAARQNPLQSIACTENTLTPVPQKVSSESPITGRYGTEPGDFTSELINSGQMSAEDRRALQRDLEAVERGSSTE